MTDTRLTALTGGIGAGKSVVARILRALGYEVYDSDCEARRIMTCSPGVRNMLVREFGEMIFDGETLRRDRLAELVFGDTERLTKLNSIVHRAVIDDVRRWRETTAGCHVFVESAILCTGGLADVVDDVWYVTADEETRIWRVMRRNNLGRDAVIARIRAQDAETEAAGNLCRHLIVNDGVSPLQPRIHTLLGR